MLEDKMEKEKVEEEKVETIMSIVRSCHGSKPNLDSPTNDQNKNEE